MKHTCFLLLGLALLLVSCGDDDSLPQFTVKVDVSGQTDVTKDGIIVAPEGNVLSIDAISIGDSSAKEITIGGASYYWDYMFVGGNIVSPYSMSFSTGGLRHGQHLLQIYIPVYAVGYSPVEGLLSYVVEIVPSDDSSGDEATGSISYTITSTPKITGK